MKRIIALVLALLMVGVLLCACGNEKTKSSDSDSSGADSATEATEVPQTVTANISARYDTGYAQTYANSVNTDESGNKVYEFDGESYQRYTHDYNNKISSDITTYVATNFGSSYGQFCYINDDKQAVIVGVMPGKYDAAQAEAQAPTLADTGFLYFQGLETPVNTIRVIYCNANNQEDVFGSFEFTAE